MKIRELEQKIIKSGVALGLALSLSACATTAALKSPYSKNMKDEDRIISIETYQKNMMRNYVESVDDLLEGKELKFKDKVGLVTQMQNERIKDYTLTGVMGIVNVIEAGYIINLLSNLVSTSSSSASSQQTLTIGTGTGQTSTGNMIGEGSSMGTTIIGFGN